MPITIKFVGAFRGVLGKDRLVLSFEDAIPLKKAIRKIIAYLPQLEQVLINPVLEDPRPNTLILVNGKEISVLDGLDTMLKSGDEVVFVPVVHGG
ncbi:MoaD/ThiS family protein [Candidatus Bathyarchaeota archaeon]|nr:MoaD/ThiS family protein [Candidatus Bathyarchaeota archaeon]